MRANSKSRYKLYVYKFNFPQRARLHFTRHPASELGLLHVRAMGWALCRRLLE